MNVTTVKKTNTYLSINVGDSLKLSRYLICTYVDKRMWPGDSSNVYLVKTSTRDRGGVLGTCATGRPTDRGSNPNADRFVYYYLPRISAKRNDNNIGNKRIWHPTIHI